MRRITAAVALGLAASLAACARPCNTPSGTPAAPSRVVTFQASAVPVQPRARVPLPSRVAERPGPACGSHPGEIRQPPATMPGPRVSPESEAAARARRALEAAGSPLPRRGPLRNAATAEDCARALRLELNLLAGGRAEAPPEPALRRALAALGLTTVTVDRSTFAASTGEDCVHGTFTAAGPELSLGPLAADGTCRR